MTYKLGPKKKLVSKVVSKVPKGSRMGEIEYLAKSTPGVGKYNLNKSMILVLLYTPHTFIEIEYLAKSTPGVGKYNLNKSMRSIEKHEYHA